MKFASSQPRIVPRREREQGMAVIVVMALISLILIYVMANLRTFNSLGHELRLLERQQIRRLEKSSSASRVVTASSNTNSAPAVSSSGAPSKSN